MRNTIRQHNKCKINRTIVIFSITSYVSSGEEKEMCRIEAIILQTHAANLFNHVSHNKVILFGIKFVALAEIAYSKLLLHLQCMPSVVERYFFFDQAIVEGSARWQSVIRGFLGKNPVIVGKRGFS